jgi:hypothetical protein
MLYVNDLIEMTAESQLKKQNADGSFPPGHNGPYYDEELPNRNTAHISILLLKAYTISKQQKFLDAAQKALSYITDKRFRPMGASFWLRKNPEKDFCNGLIGQAWICEALIYAYDFFNDDNLLKLAREIVLLHPFNENLGLWRIVNIDGSYNIIDKTFNHQLWFAAFASSLDDEEVKSYVRLFLEKIPDNLSTYRQRLIRHHVKPRGRKANIRLLFNTNLRHSQFRAGKHYKEIGYHAFNTYGFSLLYHNTKHHPFWGTEQFQRILRFLSSKIYESGLESSYDGEGEFCQRLPHNRYGFSYNPSGIEVAYTLQTFHLNASGNTERVIEEWLRRQLHKTFNWEEGLMNRNTEDQRTLSARMYESVRLKNYIIE